MLLRRLIDGNEGKLTSELFFVIPVVRRGTLELVMDGVKGIRSISGMGIKIIAPFNDEFFSCYSPAEELEAVDLVDVGNIECNTFRSNAANTPLLAALTCAAAVAEEGCPDILIFVGLESCSDTLADYEFLLRRRLAPARVFVLDTQHTTSTSLLSTDMARGCSLRASSTIRLLPPQQKRVERGAREGARAAFGLTDRDFAVLIPDDESVREESSRIARFVRALSKAQNTHFLAGTSVLQSWPSVGVPLVDADIKAPFVAAALGGANAIDAADMIVSFGSGKGISCCFIDADAGIFLAVRNNHTEKFAVLADSDACDAIDDFIKAIDMLPSDTDRSAEMLRCALVRDLQARASRGFGRSLFRAITQNHGAHA
ncbi:hypothetical protein B0G69_7946 [Paraburkholderia sp. RAU2J]|uniref:hypothetical protein n=1 Tax=Paraburkholderia sp. RAU2J TaxID=1938810 RepID=UPI000EAC98C4|nr:hypothetical protein [Paraburkholderia sp. RAU2J]RKT10519.1 hypothetical protein B0G69_7946 [Paraburkholderia sp. RAU2J]